MEREKFKEELFFDTMGAIPTGAVPDFYYGKPCFNINGKPFCVFVDEKNSMAFRMTGDIYQEALIKFPEFCELYDPSGTGHAPKDWVVVKFRLRSFWKRYAKHAAAYVDLLKD